MLGGVRAAADVQADRLISRREDFRVGVEAVVEAEPRHQSSISSRARARRVSGGMCLRSEWAADSALSSRMGMRRLRIPAEIAALLSVFSWRFTASYSSGASRARRSAA